MRFHTVLCAALLALAGSAFGQQYPSRPLEFVVHTAPGGGTDLIARVVTEIITREKLITQPVTVSNRTGGGGAIAYTYIKSKRGDPYVVMTVASGAMLSQTVRPELGLGLENYTPIAFLASDPQAVMVSADAPWKTFKELIAAARKEPDKLVASVTSPGGTGRMLVWLIERETGTKFRSVSFKSGSDAIMQVMGGHTQFSTENISEGHAAVAGKKLRILAVTSRNRLPIVPDAPTLLELGYKINVGTERGFAMPAAVPKEAAAHMEGVLRKVYDSAPWKEHAERNMYENIWMGGADYAKHLAERRGVFEQFMHGIGLVQKQ